MPEVGNVAKNIKLATPTKQKATDVQLFFCAMGL